MNKEEITSSIKSNIIPILVVIYFVRFAIPQGIYSINLTGLFYTLTIYLVVGCLIVAGLIGIIGYIRFRLKNTIFTAQHKSFLITAVLGLALFGLSFITRDAYLHINFDSDRWRNTKVSLDSDNNLLTLRQRMMKDLVENNLAGLNRSEVEALLGAPDNSWQSAEGDWTFLYVVGPEKGLGVDNECLEIHLDEKDQYKRYEDVPICEQQ
jgi:hypothetical protein